MRLIFRNQATRYILIASLALAVIFPLTNIYIIYPAFTELLIRNIEDEAERTAAHLASSLVPGKALLGKGLITNDFLNGVSTARRDFRFTKLKVFSSSGEILYSTEEKDIGELNRKSYFHDIVAKGRPYTKIVKKDTKSLEDKLLTKDVAETYIPLIADNRFIGAFEIYYDITNSSQRLGKVLFYSSLIPFIIMFGFLVLIVTTLLRLQKNMAVRRQAEEDIERSHKELAQLASDLEAKNSQMSEHRQRLLGTLDQLTALMKQVAERKDYKTIFKNPNIRNCYEKMHCSKTDCPCYGKEGMRCWQIAGTYCGGKIQGYFADKYKNCSICPVFQDAASDPIYQIGEHFNNMMHILSVEHRQLEEAYKELKTTQSHLLQQEKMASIGQLAAGVAHEINNPMGFIISNIGSFKKYVQRLLEFIEMQASAVEDLASCAAGPQQRADAILKMLKEHKESRKIDMIMTDIANLLSESLDGAQRVKKIVENLKSFSHLDEAEQKMADINSGIESTINIIWNELKYKVTLKKEYGEIPQTRCNPGELNQVFMNILVNAAHAIEKQGEVAVKTWHEAESIYVAISDTGSGIPEDKINRIFEPFFTTKEVGKGTGLGLSIAYDIIKKHNGEIRVESEVGRGTTFTIKIPVVE